MSQEDKRILLDVGRPLEATSDDEMPEELRSLQYSPDPSLLGILISHGHPDHYGLVDRFHPDIPVFMGSSTVEMLGAASRFGPTSFRRKSAHPLIPGVRLTLGPFAVTPMLVDHSAFGAMSLLVEAGGHKVFYSGDFRAHGRKSGTIARLVADPPLGVDTLILEGTRIGRHDQELRSESEDEIEARLAERFESTTGTALVAYSPLNVDRHVSIFRAAIRSGRTLVIDPYAAEVAAATGIKSIPQASWSKVRVYLPRSQRKRLTADGALELLDRLKPHRVYPEQLKERPGDFVFMFRGSMLSEVERIGCIPGASFTWSMWRGYLDRPTHRRLVERLTRMGVQTEVIHTSGHADPADLVRLADAIGARELVPVHTTWPEGFLGRFNRVALRADGEWWTPGEDPPKSNHRV